MELLFNEQDLVDSVCVFTSARERVRPEQVEVDLEFNPDFGFAATALVHGRTVRMNEQDIIDSVALYLRDYHQFSPDSLLVNLSFSETEGFTGSIQVRNNF
ncbi:YxcD family protein [Neobacillus pocheonensis]|uniref:YxcD family protein n=1 Tax=Neobacillus pocheonensis TaxID=363869 RepID=A0ABT0WAK9_9BACI|nr:YxcD family protein [Neobacillus pocheonensis]